MKPGAYSVGAVLAVWCVLSSTASGQDRPAMPDQATADTNSAVIEGRVTLPSGFAADQNAKITIRNSRSTLYTIYTNKHGEFRLHDMSEGVYYVQAEIEPYDPVIEKVELGRGITWELTLQLRERKLANLRGPNTRVVSTAELHQAVPPPAKKEYDVAIKLVSKGAYSEAAAHFKQAIDLFPEYLAARNDLGAQYLKLKRLDDAEEHFRLVLTQDPKSFNAMFNLGLVRIERRDYPDAITHLVRAIAIDSAWPAGHLWLGFAMLEQGDLPAAERELSRALVMGGAECVVAHYHLARAYALRGDPAEATRSIKAYLEEAPKGDYVKEAKELEKKLQKDVRQTGK